MVRRQKVTLKSLKIKYVFAWGVCQKFQEKTQGVGLSYGWTRSKIVEKNPNPLGFFPRNPCSILTFFGVFRFFCCTCNVILSAVPVSPRNRILSTALEVRGCPFFW